MDACDFNFESIKNIYCNMIINQIVFETSAEITS